MKPELKSSVHVQRLSLNPTTETQLRDCLRIQPGLYLRINSRDQEAEKIYFDLMFNMDPQEDSRNQLTSLFEEWDEEANRIVNQIKAKWGVDVVQSGSRNTHTNHVCKVCGKTFTKATALGGHTSKMHSFRSKNPASSTFTEKTTKVAVITVPKHKKIKKERREVSPVQSDDDNLDVIY